NEPARPQSEDDEPAFIESPALSKSTTLTSSMRFMSNIHKMNQLSMALNEVKCDEEEHNPNGSGNSPQGDIHGIPSSLLTEINLSKLMKDYRLLDNGRSGVIPCKAVRGSIVLRTMTSSEHGKAYSSTLMVCSAFS
ncbi:hypothetical protein BGZ79_006271, partial [Entomortierella chlamydospora]